MKMVNERVEQKPIIHQNEDVFGNILGILCNLHSHWRIHIIEFHKIIKGNIYIYIFIMMGCAGALVEWLKLPPWKIGDHWFVSRSGIQVSKKQNVSSLLTCKD